MKNELYSLLYVSELSLQESPACIADIVRRSRANNHIYELTGMLIFDGMRFCQYLEGSTHAVKTIMGKIEQDKRHFNIQIRHQSPMLSPRRFEEWSMAYGQLETDLGESFTEDVIGHLSLTRFEELVPHIDRDPL